MNFRGIIININPSGNCLHTNDCYFIEYMNPQKKEGGIYHAENIDDIISFFDGTSFYKCFYCDPDVDITKKAGKSITILKKESRGLPPWNLAMPPAWEQYYSKQFEKTIKSEKLEESTQWAISVTKKFLILIISLFLILLVISLIWGE